MTSRTITYVPQEDYDIHQEHLKDLQETVDQQCDRLSELEAKMKSIQSAANKFIRGGLSEEELVFMLLQTTGKSRKVGSCR